MTTSEDLIQNDRDPRFPPLNSVTSVTPLGLTNLTVSLKDEAGSDPMWKSRTMALIGVLRQVLAFLRNKHGEVIDVQRIRDVTALPRLIALSRRKDLPPEIHAALCGYLENLPGYIDGQRPGRVPLDLHGYLTMQVAIVDGRH